MISLKSKVELYESLLEQLKVQVDSAGQLAIQKALQGVSEIDFSGCVYCLRQTHSLLNRNPIILS